MQKKYKFGILGAGNMGTAIAEGAVKAGLYKPSELLLSSRKEEKRRFFKEKGFAVTGESAEIYTESEIVLISIKPQNFPEVLEKLAECKVKEYPLTVSIAAGIPFSRIEKALGDGVPIVRVMPNTPMKLGKGAAQLVKNRAATDTQLETVRKIFDTMGVTTVFEEERMINEAIPYAGSAPAYIYAFADAMAKSASSHGIDEKEALKMFCRTMEGSAELLLKGDRTPSELIKEVCSPGGTTIEGVRVLEKHGFYDIISEMCDKCISRAYELGK